MKKIFLLMFVMAAVIRGADLCAEEQSISTGNSSSFVYDDKGKRDPFLPLLNNNGNIVLYDDELILSDLTLEGIMLSSNLEASVAVVNGRIVKVHDSIGSFQVAKVLNDRIILQKGQEIFELKLKKE